MKRICGITMLLLLGLIISASSAIAQQSPAAEASKKKFPDWDEVIKGAERLDGLFPLYFNEKEQKLYLELRQDQLERELILPISIARGAGLWFLGGDTLNFGNQWVISFRRAGDRVLVVRRNIRYTAKSGSPQAESVRLSYTDSVIAAVPVRSEQQGGQRILIDLADLFMTDFAGLGINPDRARSTWGNVKAFPDNVEIEVNAVFSQGGFGSPFGLGGDDAVPDPRGTQVAINYGLSMLPTSSGYQPRVADDRVGHFLSTLRDFSTDIDDSPTVRYVTRWRLEKDDPSAEKSVPKQPIIFWIEKTVPREYRPHVRAGILEWNKAFERIGFIEAIQVRDQLSEDDFDPEDIRYNTFRWITTSAGFAMGPSRTNPKTGEILDADIVFDEGMIRYWRQEYLMTSGIPQAVDLITSGHRQALFKLFAADFPALAGAQPLVDQIIQQRLSQPLAQRQSQPTWPRQPVWEQPGAVCQCCMMGPGMRRQLGLMAAVLASQGKTAPGDKVPDEFIGQAIKEVVMHEVGHTLGLRHNFKASTILPLKDANNPDITRQKGQSGSVMDYNPTNFALKGQQQGDYFTQTLGPYDYWAIEYAYKPVSGNEAEELGKVAARACEPELVFGTDEDLYLNPDPRINAFDLGDPLEYAQQRIQLVQQSLNELAERVVAEGEGWQRARTAFDMLLGELASATYLASQYIGGQYTSRVHRGDGDGVPLELIASDKQRESLRLLTEHILSDSTYAFSAELLKRLAPDHWYDDSNLLRLRSRDYQYPVYERVLVIQQIALARLLDPDVLRAVQNAQLHAGKDQEVLKIADIFEALTTAIWSELPAAEGGAPNSDAELTISTIRRTLQREHFRRLASIVLGTRSQSASLRGLVLSGGGGAMPADARALARHHLKQIGQRIQTVLGDSQRKIDTTSRAHLEEVHDQLNKVLEASLQLSEP